MFFRRLFLFLFLSFALLAPSVGFAQEVTANKTCKVNWRSKWKLNFRGRGLLQVVKEVAEKTCYNFIISSNIRGRKVTIIAESAVSIREAYRAFLSALEAMDITILKVGGYHKLIYTRSASRKNIKTYTRGRFRHGKKDEVVTYVLRVKHIEVGQLSNILRQLSGSSGRLINFIPSGVIIVVDYASNIHRLLKIVRALDVKEAEEKDKMFLIQIDNGQAREILQKVRTIFKVISRKRSRALRRRGKPIDDGHRITKILADERTNRLILVSSHRAYLNILSLIKKLDVPLADGGKIRVHYLRYAKSTEIAQTLAQLARGRRRRRGKVPSSTDLFQGEVRITADKETNSLIIVSNQRDYENLMRVIRRLDIRRKQVFIEMVILEVSLSKTRDMGAAFHGGAVTGDEQSPGFSLFGTNLGGLNSLLLDPAALMGMALTLRGPEIPNSSGVLGAQAGGIPSFGVILRALQTNTDVDIISTPHLLTAANEQASIQVGQNVPFIAGTSFASGGAGFSLPIRQIQRQDVALTLKIKPQLNAGDRVKLDIELEITEIAGQNPELGPTTTKRRVKTTVRVKDNQTIVLGGLMRKKVSDGVAKVPILGDIPLLGALFRVSKKSSEKRNLLIFLTPHVIAGPADFRRIFKKKMKERKEFMKIFYGKKKDRSYVNTRRSGVLDMIKARVNHASKSNKGISANKR